MNRRSRGDRGIPLFESLIRNVLCRPDLSVKSVTFDPTGRTAVAQVTIVRHFFPKIGRAPAPQQNTEVRLERRGEGWVITNIR